MSQRHIMQKALRRFRRELYDSVLPFWMRHSPDRRFGGYFTCLDEKGAVFDDRKYMWLQGRQIWLFSRMYNAVERRPAWLTMARLGAEFMRRHGKTSDGRVCFCLTRNGQPISIQRKIFSECFYCLGLSEYAAACGDRSVLDEALNILGNILRWADDPSVLGRPVFAGTRPVRQLAVPMILLNLMEEMQSAHPDLDFSRETHRRANEILLHLQPQLGAVLETVAPDGKPMPDIPEGRLINPGHALEASWFLIQHNRRRQDASIQEAALRMVDWSLERGWDRRHGGILYFLDALGKPPVQLEWNLKLWWVHVEAIYAVLCAYAVSGQQKYLQHFQRITDWTFAHFPDHKYGEWFGYLDRAGLVSQRLKGGPYKGCFHIPRFLLYSIKLIDQILAADGTGFPPDAVFKTTDNNG